MSFILQRNYIIYQNAADKLEPVFHQKAEQVSTSHQ